MNIMIKWMHSGEDGEDFNLVQRWSSFSKPDRNVYKTPSIFIEGFQHLVFPYYLTRNEIGSMLDRDHWPLDFIDGGKPDHLDQSWEYYRDFVNDFHFENPAFSLLQQAFSQNLILYLLFGKKSAMIMNEGSILSSKWIRQLKFVNMMWFVNRETMAFEDRHGKPLKEFHQKVGLILFGIFSNHTSGTVIPNGTHGKFLGPVGLHPATESLYTDFLSFQIHLKKKVMMSNFANMNFIFYLFQIINTQFHPPKRHERMCHVVARFIDGFGSLIYHKVGQ
jgi:hypothetical protein